MIDTQSNTWREINKEINIELKKLNKRLLCASTPHDQTMYLRGSIASLIKVLEMPKPKEPVVINNTEY